LVDRFADGVADHAAEAGEDLQQYARDYRGSWLA
jgi:hypothetical protein